MLCAISPFPDFRMPRGTPCATALAHSTGAPIGIKAKVKVATLRSIRARYVLSNEHPDRRPIRGDTPAGALHQALNLGWAVQVGAPSAVSKDILAERFQGFTSEVLMHPVHELVGR